MKRIKSILLLSAFVALVVPQEACRLSQPSDPRDILHRSFRAHGGEKLTNWQTLSIEGTVEMMDGIKYHAAYLLYAKMPDKLKVEHDLTADRGRRFTEYFLNNGIAWRRQNLIPGQADPAQLRRWWNQCFGIGYYERNAKSIVLKEQASAADSDLGRAYLLEVEADGAVSQLTIDKKSFYLLREDQGNVRRQYGEFKTFDGVVCPMTIIETINNRQGETVTPFQIRSVKYNAPIEDWLFAEDMPAK